MTIDKQNLKALAEAANAVTSDVNITMAVGTKPEEVKAVQDYLQLAMPRTVLALLAEIERLHDSHEQVCANYNRVSFSSEERGKQVDQLKAENEALRKDAERYRWLRDECGVVAYKEIVGSIGPGMLPSGEMLEEAIDAAKEREACHV